MTYSDAAKAYAEEHHGDVVPGDWYHARDNVRAFVRAAYDAGAASSRQPVRVLTTEAELDALPVGTPIQDDAGIARHRLASGDWTDPGDAPEMMEVIVDVINDAVETLTEAEVARAKAQMKAGLLMALESCSSRAEQLARHILAYGRPLTVEELVARIDAVSVESTRNAARGLLSRSRPAVVALGSGRGLDTAVAFAEGLTRSKAKSLPLAGRPDGDPREL